MKKVALALILIFLYMSFSARPYTRYFVLQKPNVIYSQNVERRSMDAVVSDYICNNYFNWSNVKNMKKFEVYNIYGVKKLFGYEYCPSFRKLFPEKFRKEMNEEKILVELNVRIKVQKESYF